eukprot:PhF_6_TR24827/c1_g1_i1/m.34227
MGLSDLAYADDAKEAPIPTVCCLLTRACAWLRFELIALETYAMQMAPPIAPEGPPSNPDHSGRPHLGSPNANRQAPILRDISITIRSGNQKHVTHSMLVKVKMDPFCVVKVKVKR